MKRCKHHNRRLCLWCISTTLSFPVEHLMWERMPILSGIARAMGL